MKSSRQFIKNPLGLIGGLIILFFFLLSFFGHYLSLDPTEDANTQNIQLQYLSPNTIIRGYMETDKSTFRPIDSSYMDRQKGRCHVRRYHMDIWKGIDCQEIVAKRFLLGSDSLGRDIWSRLVVATRYSIFLGLFAVVVSLLFGGLLGILAGYYGGWADRIVSFVIQLFWAIPTTLLAMTMAIGNPNNSYSQWLIIVFAVGLTMWVDIARLIRGLIIQIKNKEYILATQAIGMGDFRTIWRHIIPHTIPALMVMMASNFASAILVESGLSYLGLGIQPPTPSWGGLLREYYHYIGTEFSYLAIFPASFILMSVLAFYFIGNAIRDIYHLRK